MILAQKLMGGSFAGDADRIIAAMTVQPDATRTAIIRTAVQQIKDSGAWGKLDGFFMLAAHASQAGRINWINPAFVAPIAGTVAFTTDRGFTPNGSGGSYVNANGVSISKRTLSSSCIGIRVTDTLVNGAAQDDAGQGGNLSLRISGAGSLASAALDSSTASSTSTVSTNSRHVVGSRSGSITNFYAGLSSMSAIGSQSVTPAGVISNSPFIGASDNVSSSARRFGCAYFGGYLTASEISNLNSAIHAYMTAIGSP